MNRFLKAALAEWAEAKRLADETPALQLAEPGKHETECAARMQRLARAERKLKTTAFLLSPFVDVPMAVIDWLFYPMPHCVCLYSSNPSQHHARCKEQATLHELSEKTLLRFVQTPSLS